MFSVIVSLLLSLNLISSEQEFFDLPLEQQQEYSIVIEDMEL